MGQCLATSMFVVVFAVDLTFPRKRYSVDVRSTPHISM